MDTSLLISKFLEIQNFDESDLQKLIPFVLFKVIVARAKGDNLVIDCQCQRSFQSVNCLVKIFMVMSSRHFCVWVDHHFKRGELCIGIGSIQTKMNFYADVKIYYFGGF